MQHSPFLPTHTGKMKYLKSLLSWHQSKGYQKLSRTTPPEIPGHHLLGNGAPYGQWALHLKHRVFVSKACVLLLLELIIYIIFLGVCLSEIIDECLLAAGGQRLFMTLKKKRQTEITMDSVEGAWEPLTPCCSHFCEQPCLGKWSLDESLSLYRHTHAWF